MSDQTADDDGADDARALALAILRLLRDALVLLDRGGHDRAALHVDHAIAIVEEAIA